mgnify:CR=1
MSKKVKKDKIDKEKIDELMKIVSSWLLGDMSRAGYIFRYIEKGNEAYARGYRAALHGVIKEAERIFGENYLP